MQLTNTLGKGLTVDGTTNVTTLSGGTNSSSLTLQDGSATLSVGTAAPASELPVIQATNVGGNTTVAIGGAANTSASLTSGTNSLTVSSSTGTAVVGAMTVNAGGGATELSIGTGTVDVVGTTNINTSGSAATNIGTGTNSGPVAIGNANNTVAITGGATSMTVDNSGVTLTGNQAGGTARITGVANGINPTDAVNFGQLSNIEKTASRGVAAAMAASAIPQVDPNKTFMVGVAGGYYNGQNAIAVGASYRMAPNAVVKANLGTGGDGKTAVGVGAGFSW